jgi:hypothetical protein
MAANAGTTAEDAIKALPRPMRRRADPGFRVWEAFQITIPGLGNLHFNSTFVIGVA